jgi:hypothetical protein
MNREAIEKLLQPKPLTSISALPKIEPMGEVGDFHWRNRPVYEGRELQTNAGLPEGRMAAYKLPSRVGNKLYYPDGRVEPLA